MKKKSFYRIPPMSTHIIKCSITIKKIIGGMFKNTKTLKT